MSIEVTVRDTENGDTRTGVIENNFIIITAGNCEVTNTQIYANGTTVITVKRGAS